MLPSGSRLMGICLKFTVPFRLHQHGLEVMYLDHMNACFRNTRSFHLFDTTSMINPLIQCSYHLGGWVSQRDTLYLASASRRRRWEKEIENHRDTCFRRAFLGCDGCIIYQNRSWLCYIYIYLCSWIRYGSDAKICWWNLSNDVREPDSSSICQQFWLHLSRPWIITGCCGHIA